MSFILAWLRTDLPRRWRSLAALTTFVVDYSFAFEGIPGDAYAFPPGDDQTMTTLKKPVVYKGRVFNPASADEVVVSRQFVANYHEGVGRPSAQGPNASAHLNAAMAKINPAYAGVFEAPDLPTAIAEIRQVRVLPILLGAFLALLAIGAVGHALATAVRRRAHDLAVLCALGMTPWQSRWVTVTHATVVAVIGLVFGVPLGLAIGRSVWRAVADYTPIAYVPPLAVWALALVGPAVLLISMLLAGWPSQRAARLRVATILRAE
jgi:hypothetical protein